MDSVNGEKILQPISVMMVTHNRTNVACATIDAIVKNLRYKDIQWIISDDRSDNGHVERLVQQFKDNGIDDVVVCKTNSERWGLGAAMNNGLRKAFEYSDIVLTMEDDWILQKELNPSYFIHILKNVNAVSTIRLATLINAKSRPLKSIPWMEFVYPEGGMKSVFNNQVALRHKRIYDDLGYYRENCTPDESENDMIDRFNFFMKKHQNCILFPSFLKKGVIDDPSLYFIHVGKSTQDHKYKVPERYKWIYGEKNETVLKNKEQQTCQIKEKEHVTVSSDSNNEKTNAKLPTVTVVMTTHNRTNVACAVIDSLVKNLKYDGQIKWCISDDRSEPGHVWCLVDQFNKNNIYDVHVERTNDERYGLGASLNNGLKYAWKNSDIVFTTEDDWLFINEFDITKCVYTINKDISIAAIRFGRFDNYYENCSNYSSEFAYVQTKTHKTPYIFNNQVALRHKRAYDILGYYRENCGGDLQEIEMVVKFDNITNNGYDKLKVLRPLCIPAKPSNRYHPYIRHIGKSVTQKINSRGDFDSDLETQYRIINNKDIDDKLCKTHVCIVGIATYDKRINTLNTTLERLIPQCDEINVALNGYSEVPGFLIRNKKVNYFPTVNNFPDLGCNNKMRWINKATGYYLTADDDITYPYDYVERMIQAINKYDKNVVCSFHGSRFTITNNRIFDPLRNYKCIGFGEGVDYDTWTDMPGGAVMGFYPSKINIKSETYINLPKNSGDDEITAIFCQKNKIPVIRPKTTKCWLKITPQTQKFALWNDQTSVKKRWDKMTQFNMWNHNKNNLKD